MSKNNDGSQNLYPKVVVIAGGKSSRFFPFNTGTHKASYQLCGKPIIIHTLENLRNAGFSDVCLIVGAQEFDSGIEETLEEYGFSDVVLKVQQQPSGMGDAVLLGTTELEEQSFFVISAYHVQAPEVLKKLYDLDHTSALCVTQTPRPWEYGVVTLDQNNRVIDLVEKPTPGTEPSDLKLSSVYLLSSSFRKILADEPEDQYSFESALKKLCHHSPLPALKMESSLLSLKYAWDLFLFKDLFLKKQLPKIADSAKVAQTALLDESKGAIVIDEGAIIGDFVKIVGPCYVGKKALVGDYSFVRESCIESEAVVGANTEVVRSIIGPDSSIHFGYMADSIIGKKSKIGAGLITTNKRLDRAQITCYFGDKKFQTSLKALGLIAGNNVKIGAQVTVMPGIIMGNDSVVYPATCVKRSLEIGQVLE